jgi:prepilin-type N-terminal cleavage/methylation domain-containing protein
MSPRNSNGLSQVRRGKDNRGIATRRGFTLIELMITIAIMGILASILLGALWKASITAKEMRTRSLIAKLNNHIIPRWESYRSRRLLFDPSLILNAQVPNGLLTQGQITTRSQIFPLAMVWQPGVAPLSRRHMQGIRLMAIRELMRLEMPERFQDITLSGSPAIPPTGAAVGPLIVPARTSMSQNYWVKMQLMMPSPKFESAECLYQMITMGLEDGGLGQEHFSQADVGDLDGDGWPEFLDAWGNPIFFLRWAPHFYSPLQPRWSPGADGVLNTSDDPSPRLLDPYDGVPDVNGNMRGLADSGGSHDPYDLMQDDHDAFSLTPLVYSAGADGIYDIVPGDYCTGSSQPFASSTISYNSPLNYFDPGNIYILFSNHQTTLIASAAQGTHDFYNPTAFGHSPFAGAAIDYSNDSNTNPGPANGRLNHWDNIHNHLLGR